MKRIEKFKGEFDMGEYQETPQGLASVAGRRCDAGRHRYLRRDPGRVGRVIGR